MPSRSTYGYYFTRWRRWPEHPHPTPATPETIATPTPAGKPQPGQDAARSSESQTDGDQQGAPAPSEKKEPVKPIPPDAQPSDQSKPLQAPGAAEGELIMPLDSELEKSFPEAKEGESPQGPPPAQDGKTNGDGVPSERLKPTSEIRPRSNGDGHAAGRNEPTPARRPAKGTDTDNSDRDNPVPDEPTNSESKSPDGAEKSPTPEPFEDPFPDDPLPPPVSMEAPPASAFAIPTAEARPSPQDDQASFAPPRKLNVPTESRWVGSGEVPRARADGPQAPLPEGFASEGLAARGNPLRGGHIPRRGEGVVQAASWSGPSPSVQSTRMRSNPLRSTP